jgi:protein-disulfide isomerase
LRNYWVIGVVVVVLAVAGFVAYRQLGPDAAPEQAATTETTAPAPVAETPAADPAAEAVEAPKGEPVPEPTITPDDHVMGVAEAPVTIVEYASLTCPHCAAFHTQTLPELKSAYIDTGKVRLVYRDFPLDRVALAASLLTRCVPEERYFAMLDVLFKSQDSWAGSTEPAQALSQIGRTGGLDQAKIDACLADQATTDKIVAGIQEAQNQFKINSTPTLIINGTKYSGALSFAQMEAVLKDLLPQ